MNTPTTPATTPAQPDEIAQVWRWCHKCQGLFYGRGEANSVCPAGEKHDGTGSGSYVLVDVTGI